MADDAELEEFRAWKRSKEKEEIFGVLDEWAERSGLKKLLEDVTGDDDADATVSLADAAAKVKEGKTPKPPKPEPKEDPVPEPQSLAARLGLTA